MGIDLFTLAEYKAYVGISSINQDTEIKAIIPIASQMVKTYCRRTFVDYVNDAKTEVFGGGGERIFLSEFPVLAVSSVEQSVDYGSTYTTLVEFTDYAVDHEDDGIVPINTVDNLWPRLINGYKVTYTGGYEDVPDDLKVAAMDLATYYLKNDMAVKAQRAAGANTVQIEYITKNTLPSHIVRVLDMYLANVS